MKHQHQRTLQALFDHPIQHNLRTDAVEALLEQLGASIERLADHRLRLQLGSGEVLFLRAASGPQRTHLDGEGILRLRHWLQQAGITPDLPDPITTQAVRGDQARRLLIHLDHKGARLWWLEGEEVHGAELIPHGLWGCGQRLSHRHDRDIAGQRAPERPAPSFGGAPAHAPIDDTACTEKQLLALARAHFGNAPHRQPLKIPGQEWREL